MKSLEQQLGRVLIVRGKPARATAAGAAVVRLARQIALLEHDALAQLGVEAVTARVHVPLAVYADSMATWFLRPLARLTQNRGIDFDLHRDDQSFTARLLESGEVMAAATNEATPVAGCTSISLGVLAYRAVATSEFIDRWLPAGVDADSLSSAPFVDFDRKDDLQQEWLRRRGVNPAGVPRHYVPASHDYATAVALGMGWGMLSQEQVDGALGGTSLIALGEPAIRVPLYWQQWNLRSPLLDAIAAEVATEAARVLEQSAG